MTKNYDLLREEVFAQLSMAMADDDEASFDALLNKLELNNFIHQKALTQTLSYATNFDADKYVRKLLIKGAEFPKPPTVFDKSFEFYQNIYSAIVKHKDISHRQHTLLLRQLLTSLSFVTNTTENAATPFFQPRNKNNEIIYQLIEYLIKEGPVILLPEKRQLFGDANETLLFHFVSYTQTHLLDVYSLLLDRTDFDINSLNNFKQIQLMAAIHGRNLAAIKLILSKRKDVNFHLPNCHGKTAFSWVLNEFQQDGATNNILRTLLEHGAGLYAEVSALPASLNLDNLVVIGMKLNKKPVHRNMPGFSNAITTAAELFYAIKNGIELEITSLINACRHSLAMNRENSNYLEKIVAILEHTYPVHTADEQEEIIDTSHTKRARLDAADTLNIKKSANTLQRFCLTTINHTLLFKPKIIILELYDHESTLSNDLSNKISISHAKNQHKRRTSF